MKAKWMLPSMRAYFIRLTTFMLLYAIILVSVLSAFRSASPPTGMAAFFLSALPALPIVGVFWTIGRLITETTDEYQRLLLVKQTLLATGITLSIETVWAFLDNFDQVPPRPMFHVGVLWLALWGISGAIVRFRA